MIARAVEFPWEALGVGLIKPCWWRGVQEQHVQDSVLCYAFPWASPGHVASVLPDLREGTLLTVLS